MCDSRDVNSLPEKREAVRMKYNGETTSPNAHRPTGVNDETVLTMQRETRALKGDGSAPWR
jgi:hypothetical protein